MIKLGFVILIVFIFISGCTSDCIVGEDNKINISVVENRDVQTNMGLSNHHIVTLNITNIGDSLAKFVIVNSYYCNELKLGQRTCENRTISIGDLPPKATISKNFEYDRVLIQNQLDGSYQLQYSVDSCLPITIINNSVYVHQR